MARVGQDKLWSESDAVFFAHDADGGVDAYGPGQSLHLDDLDGPGAFLEEWTVFDSNKGLSQDTGSDADPQTFYGATPAHDFNVPGHIVADTSLFEVPAGDSQAQSRVPRSLRYLRYRVSSPRPNSPSLSQKRLPDFFESWSWILHPNHPMINIGHKVLQDLHRFQHLEYHVDLWCYAEATPDHSCRALDLIQRVWHDLDALGSLPEYAIIADQRPTPSLPLTHGRAALAALNAWLPVAFEVPLNSERGMRGAPEACVPHHVVHAIDRVFVAGSGTLLPPHRSTSLMPTVLHVILGKLVLIHLPLTHANENGATEKFGLAQSFLWAISQPSAVLRVLYAGESAFIPSMHWRCMIALGRDDSSFAGVVLLQVRRADMVTACEAAN